MTLSRRTMLISSAAIAATMASAAGVAATGLAPALVVFDSRSALSIAFASGHAAPRIDVAHEDANLWRGLRSVAAHGAIIGLTGWSDWVVVRGLLEEKGKRLKAENRSGKLFQWSMA